MKRKFEIVLLVSLVGLCLAVILLTTGNGDRGKDYSYEEGSAITIRNATKGVINYRIKPGNPFDEPKRMRLNAGGIHRYPSKVTMDIRFDQLGREITRRLSPGMPYSFRYDENNLIMIYEGSHGRKDAVDLAPYLSTPMEVVDKMLELAQVDESDVLYDIGCGDGRVVIEAAKKYGTNGVGIDIIPQRIRESNNNAKKAGVEKLVTFLLGDAMKADISEATVVTLYLLPESNELLRPKFERQLRPGVYVVSHNYRIPGWEDKEVETMSMKDKMGSNHTLFLYIR
ncbi:MAG: cyclopropane-fatty-acyl-phospholipid synthase family protein [Candidatus Aminicenantaceae bacterium]